MSIMLCWKQKDATLFDGNENYQPAEGWLQRHPESQSEKKNDAGWFILLEFHWSKYKLHSVGSYMCEPQARVL